MNTYKIGNKHLMPFISTAAVVLLAAVTFACSEPAPAPVAPQAPADTSPRLGVNSLAIDLQFAEGDSKTVTRSITVMNEGEG